MAVPGRPVPAGAPAKLVNTELFAVDAYLREFDAYVEEVDPTGHRVALRRTAFYPGGGGQPHDLGTLRWSDGAAAVLQAGRVDGRRWGRPGAGSAGPVPGGRGGGGIPAVGPSGPRRREGAPDSPAGREGARP